MSGREPVTVFKCPCGRYIVTSNGLDDHLKTCRVLLHKLNTSGNNCEDDTPIINPQNSSKPDVVVGNVFGVEIIEFRPANVGLRRTYLKESKRIDLQTLTLSNSSASVSKRGRQRKISKILEAKHSESNYDEDSDESLNYEEKLNDKCSLPSASKKRTTFDSNPDKLLSFRQRSTDTFADDLYSFKCTVCPYTRFKDESRFNWHMENVHGDKRKNSKLVSCPLCGRMFVKKDLLQHHLRHHENAEGLEDAFNLWESWPEKKPGARLSLTFSCKYCLIPHSSHNSFITHMKTEHPDKGRFLKILCPYCQIHEFDKIKLFVVHMRSSHNGKYYGATSQFQREQKRTRNETRPCPVCKKLYQGGYLREHLENKHSVRSDLPIPEADLERFVCPLCSTRIKSRIQLKRHFVLHLDNNPYVCKVTGCSYKGDAPCHLARHMRLHTGADLVKCPKCNVFYSRSDHMSRHKCVFDPNQLMTDPNGFLRSKLAKSKYSIIVPQQDILTEEAINNVKKSFKTYRININDIIKTDPVYLRVVEENPDFPRIIFGSHAGSGPVLKPKQLSTKVSYRCDPCHTRFYDKHALATHKKICEVRPSLKKGHTGPEKLGCPICGSSFENFKVLVDHVEGSHPTKVFKCEDCERFYSAQHIIDRHSESHKKPFACMSCQRRFATPAEQTEHKNLCGGRQECSKCGKILVNRTSWQRHWKLIHGITIQVDDCPGVKPKENTRRLPYKCKPCGTLLFDKNALATHRKICKGKHLEGKTKEDRHGCPICGDSFENFELLLQHVEVCHPLKVFKCDDCKRMFSKSQTLKSHLQWHMEKFRCNSCYQRFSTLTGKNEHKLKCKTEKCSECGKILRSQKAWRRHWKLVHRKSLPKRDFEDYAESREDIQETTKKKNMEDIWIGKNELVVKKEPTEPVCYIEAGGDIDLGLQLPVDTIVEPEELKPVVNTYVMLSNGDEGEFNLSS